MHTLDRLRVSWWNTSLFPPKAMGKEAPAPSPERRSIAETVVRHLIEYEGVDILALGEISSNAIERLIKACPQRPALWYKMPEKVEGTPVLNVGIVYDRQKLEFIRGNTIEDEKFGRTKVKQYHVSFRSGLTDDLIHVIAAHWPSRLRAEQETWRKEHGRGGRQLIDRICREQADAPYVIYLGDFNDEPFDPSIADELQSSRDRSLVRKRNDLLYNPFWRWLGEQQLMEVEGSPRLPAGTYFYPTETSHWHTFDQILVSKTFLMPSGWTLDERKTGIWSHQCLIGDNARLLEEFDHLPVVATFAWQAGDR